MTAPATDERPTAPEAPAAPAGGGHSHATRQAIMYCPYCAEETLFPLEKGWECRSCLRAFSISFLGLRPAGGSRS